MKRNQAGTEKREAEKEWEIKQGKAGYSREEELQAKQRGDPWLALFLGRELEMGCTLL